MDSVEKFSYEGMVESGAIWVDDFKGRSGYGEGERTERGGGKVPLNVFKVRAKVGCVIDFIFKQLTRN